ncbi:hypothetical protein [Streptomyces phytohabitans]|uniref:hypothetical protein n=1 Tax=Streptomyces phytohabitans TaxID=1150371 RepID=UPI00345BCD7E
MHVFSRVDEPYVPAPPAPRWAVRAAHAAALVTLPTGVWRLLLAAGFPAGYTATGYAAMDATGRGAVYLVALSVVSEVLALLTLGLVRPWGEVVPSRVPGWGGRVVAPRVVTAVAGCGAVVLTLLWTPFVAWWALPHPDLTDTGAVVVGLLYLPLTAWGPLLGAVTVAYHRRHRASPSPNSATRSAC